MRGQYWVLVAICTALTACQAQSPANGETDVARSCGAARLSGWVGQDVSTLDEQYLPQIVRLIRPGDAITEDHKPGRLNVVLSKAGAIKAFYCG
ncbi:I78 family peptidase inhibitor [Gemmobacter serpentinus]|uniref:I78 family peptidase inhibitor n=1 Tax=Gemmobacter serpentinus TaxID=2652247 RepID=UPI00124DF11A|nr:I78 family peptidase inhibitor [Gemmobacter serpentinus]